MPRSPQIQPATVDDHVRCIFHLTPNGISSNENQETSIKRKNVFE